MKVSSCGGMCASAVVVMPIIESIVSERWLIVRLKWNFNLFL